MRTQCRIVLVTCASLSESRRLSRAILDTHLAACVNSPSVSGESIYRWKGKVETAREYLLLVKTTRRRLKALEKEVLRLHSYDTPEFIALPVTAGSSAYLRWLSDQT